MGGTQRRQGLRAAPKRRVGAPSCRAPRTPRHVGVARTIPTIEDAGQGDARARGWGWWNTGTWQSGSSGSGWWNRPERGNDGDDTWSRWNRGRRAPRTGGYGGADRLRPKPAHTAAALERHLTREEWIEELIADPPNPAHPEFRAPGSWGRWVRCIFFTYRKTGDAKYRVKMKRGNINREAPGADPDYNTRGGRSAAMDPSTIRPGGQKRQERSRDDDDYRGAPRPCKGGSRGLHRRRVACREARRGIGRGHRGRKRQGHPSRRPQR